MPKKMFLLCVAIPIIIVTCALFKHIAAVARYDMYAGETTAVVKEVESRRTPFKKRRSHEYKIWYAYYVDDEEHEVASSWVSYNKARAGQEVIVRFDPEDPGNSMLAIEKADAVSGLYAMAIIGGTVAFVAWLSGRNKKKQT